MKKRILIISVSIIFALLVSGVHTGTAVSISSKNEKYLSMLRVVYVTEEWSAYDGLSWEQQLEIRATDNFQWYEAVIWDSYAVHLYKFDQTFDTAQYWRLSPEAWVNYRESYRLVKYDLPAGADDSRLSRSLLEAFKLIFETMIIDTPSQHYGMRYSGHGCQSALFQCLMTPSDSRQLLTYVSTYLGKNLDLLDFGGVCNQGDTEVLSAFYQHVDYIIGSPLAMGGYSMDEWTMEKQNEVSPDYQYPLIMTPDDTFKENLVEVINLYPKRWEYSKNNMITDQVMQSISLYQSDAFEDLAQTVGEAIRANGEPDFNEYDDDLLSYIKYLGRSDIEQLFYDLRIEYRSNEDFFPWNYESNGLSIHAVEHILPDFFILNIPESRLCQPGSMLSIYIDVETVNGFQEDITFSEQWLPDSMTASFTSLPNHTLMVITIDESTQLGGYIIDIKAEGGEVVHTASISIKVVEQVYTTYLPMSFNGR